MGPLPLFATQVAIYAAFPLALATLRAPLRTVALYIYFSIVLVLAGFLGSVYSLPIAPSVNISGGNLAYGAFLYTAVLLLIIQRNVSVLRDIIWLVILVNGFKFLIFGTIAFSLENQQVFNPFKTSPDLFTSSAYFLLLGGGLIVLELLLLVLIFERAKRHISNPALLAIVYPLSFIAVLMLDGVLFPTLALGFDPGLVEVVIGNVQGKLWLALAYSIPLLLFLLLFRARLQDYAGTPLSLRDLRFDPQESLLQEIAERGKQLAESEQRFRQVWEATSDAMALSDPEGIVQAANPAYFDLYGYRAEQVIGHSFAIIFPAEMRESAVAQYKKIFANKKTPPPFESVIQRVDGTERVVDSRVAFLTSAGRPTAMLSTIRDITERKQVEDALRESEGRFRALVDASLEGIALVQDGKIAFVNQSNCDISGYSFEESVGRSASQLLDAIHPDDRAGVLERQARFMRGEPVSEANEIRIIRKDGDVRWVWTSTKPVVIDGKPGRLAMMIDVTDRKQAEEQIRYQAHLIESVSEAIISTDLNYVIQSWNRAAETIYGWQATEVIGKRIMDVVSTVYPDSTREQVLQSFHAQGSWKGEVIQERKDGTSLAILSSVAYAWDSTGNPSGIVAVNRDISQSKRAEEALRESQEFLRNLLENAPVSIYMTGVDGRLRLANRQWEKDTGKSRADVIGSSLDEIFPAEYAYAFTEDNHAVIETDLPQTFEESVGPQQLLTVKFPLHDELGNLTSVGGISVDITERKLAEEALAQAHVELRAVIAHWQTAVEAERARIAREIHDDFGQSMTALKMDIDWLNRRLPEGDERRPRLAGMNQLVDNSIHLMRRIATELRPGVLDDLGLNAAIHWQAGEFSRRADIPCHLHLPPDEFSLNPEMKTSLFRILQETLTNVARHAQATQVEVSLMMKDQTLILTVEDDGRGITGQEIADPRALGLLGLRERVAQWGGECAIHGTPGRGTSVTVQIPLPAEPVKGDGP